MGRIFRQAHVISYIGGNTDARLASTCLAVFRRLADISDYICSGVDHTREDMVELPPIMYNSERPPNMPDWNHVPWDTMARLLKESYFSRLWMFQEIRLARSHTCQWGLHSCSMYQLNEASRLIWIGASENFTLTPLEGGDLRSLSTAQEHIQVMSGDPLTFGRELDFCSGDFTTVEKCMRFGCSDPRDHIYGLASLFQGFATYPVNYALSVDEVFAGFVFHLLKVRGPNHPAPLFLTTYAHQSTCRDPDTYASDMGWSWSSRSLPSWCPDFGLRRPGSRQHAEDIYAGDRVPGPNSHLPAHIVPKSARILNVRGVRCATVAACSNHNRSDENSLKFVSKSGRLALRLQMHRSSNDICKEVLDALRGGSRAVDRGVYPSHPFNKMKSPGDHWLVLGLYAHFYLEKHLPCIHALHGATEFHDQEQHMAEIQDFVDEMKHTIHHFALMIRRCFITTPKIPLGARIGCGSDAVRVGDEVFVLYGVETPILIRGVGNQGHYKFVGSCYLNGLMEGEAPGLGLPVEDILLV